MFKKSLPVSLIITLALIVTIAIAGSPPIGGSTAVIKKHANSHREGGDDQVFPNHSTLLKFGAGPTYNGQAIGGGGVTVHGNLTGRDTADQHPRSAITGLDAVLDNLSSAIAGGGFSGDATSYKGNATPTATEFSYIAGLTSAAQTQINTKLATTTAASTYKTIAGFNEYTSAGGGRATVDEVEATYASKAGILDYSELPPAVANALNSGRFVNVLDYGVVGDGVTDDTAAIQAAIDAAAVLSGNNSSYGIPVVFPWKRYLVTATLTNEYAMPLIGQFGRRLNNDATGIVANSDITVLDYATTHPSNDQDIILYGMHIQNIYATPTKPLIKTFTHVDNGAYKGQTNDGYIVNNWFYGGNPVAELERMQGYQIINNVFHGNGTNTEYALKAMGLKNSVIMGNRIFQVSKGSAGSAPLLLTSSVITGESTMVSSMVTVVGNQIDANVDDACILVQAAEGINIHDNNIRSGKYGVRVDGSAGAKTISIKNNQISNNTHEYILVDSTSNVQINGNTFQNMLVGSTGSVVETDAYYVSATGTATNVQVVGNNFNSVNPATYSAGTTYKMWDTVLSSGVVYHSLQDSNTGNTPASSPTFWTSRGIVKTKGVSLGASISDSFYGQNIGSSLVTTAITDSGTGNTNYDTGGAGTPGGNDRTIQFNSSGALEGSDDLTFDSNSRIILKRSLASGLGAGWLYTAAVDTAPAPAATPAALSQRWSRGTIASPLRAQSGDMFAALDWRTYQSTDDVSAASVTNPLVYIYAKATASHTASDTSHSLIFNLNPDNTATTGASANDVLTLTSAGNITVNKTGALLTTPALKIDHATATDGYVWTATDADGNGQWETITAIPAVKVIAPAGTIAAGDNAIFLTDTGGTTITRLPAYPSINGFSIFIRNNNANAQTIAPLSAGQKLNGVVDGSYSIPTGKGVHFKYLAGTYEGWYVMDDGNSGTATSISTGDTAITTTDTGDGYITFTEDNTEYGRLTGGLLTFTNANSLSMQSSRSHTETNVYRASFAVNHITTNDMADGFGSAIAFRATDSGATNQLLGQVAAVRSNNDDDTGDIIFAPATNGVAAEKFRITYGGAATFQNGGSANKVICWKSDGKTLGYCSSAVDSGGGCTCN